MWFGSLAGVFSSAQWYPSRCYRSASCKIWNRGKGCAGLCCSPLQNRICEPSCVTHKRWRWRALDHHASSGARGREGRAETRTTRARSARSHSTRPRGGRSLLACRTECGARHRLRRPVRAHRPSIPAYNPLSSPSTSRQDHPQTALTLSFSAAPTFKLACVR